MIQMPKCMKKGREKAAGGFLSLILALVLTLFLCTGCGRKAPPRLPEKNKAQAAAEWIELRAFPV